MNKVRYETLDGWRGLAALAIAFYHFPVAHSFREMAGWKNLEFFVDFFFVLSGFVICHAWGQRLASLPDARTFMLRRFWRVWPLHFAVLFVFFALELAEWGAWRAVGLSLGEAPFSGPSSLPALLSNIVLVQSFNLHGTTTWNGPAWSISVEFWTYLVFAAVMLLFRGKAWALALVAAAGAIMVALWSPIWLFATHDYGMPRALYGFFVGALVYRLLETRGEGGRAGTMLELAALGAMILWMASTGMNVTSMFAPIVFAGLVVVFARGGGVVSAVLLSRPVQALGLWSYSIYLVHTLIYYGLRLVLVAAEKKLGLSFTESGSGSARVFTFGSGIADGVVILLLLALTIAISAWTYRWIERPFMASGSGEKSSRPAREPALASG